MEHIPYIDLSVRRLTRSKRHKSFSHNTIWGKCYDSPTGVRVHVPGKNVFLFAVCIRVI